MSNRKIAIGIGGSSGSIYAYLLLQKLTKVNNLEVGVVMSENALINWEIEIGHFSTDLFPFRFYKNNDFFAPFASGSAQYEIVVICPCSMGLLGRIANGVSGDLITRAADVALKERRKLIIVPRETPYNSIHLENMLTLTRAGAIICPATPSFYSKPSTIEEVCNTVVDRVVDLMGLQVDTFRWGEDQ